MTTTRSCISSTSPDPRLGFAGGDLRGIPRPWDQRLDWSRNSGGGRSRRSRRHGPLAFFAPDRQGIAWRPVYEPVRRRPRSILVYPSRRPGRRNALPPVNRVFHLACRRQRLHGRDGPARRIPRGRDWPANSIPSRVLPSPNARSLPDAFCCSAAFGEIPLVRVSGDGDAKRFRAEVCPCRATFLRIGEKMQWILPVPDSRPFARATTGLVG